MKQSIEVEFGSNAVDILAEMFKSWYKGETLIPIADFFDIKLPEYVIKVKTFNDEKHLEVYNQNFEKCKIKYIVENWSKIDWSQDSLQISRDISSSTLTKVEMTELDDIIVNSFLWSTYLFNLYFDIIPFTNRYVLDKKKRKKVVRVYHLTDDFLRDKIVFPALTDFDYSNIVNIPKIYTNFEITEKLFRKYKEYETAEILVPFKEFAIAFEDEKMYYCKYKKDKLCIIEYEKGEKMLGFVIDTQKKENGDYTYLLTPYDFYKYNDRDIDHKFIGGYGISIILLTLYFYTRFAVRKVFVNKEKPNHKNHRTTNKTFVKEDVRKEEVIVLPKVQNVYSYSIIETVKSGKIRPRKEPIYIKEQWQKQGFYRRTKGGKIVWVRPTTCTRHKETKSRAQHIILDASKV